MANTMKPTGLEIDRNGTTVSLSWKSGQTYNKQEYKWTFDKKYPKAAGTITTTNGWVALNNGTTHSATVTLPESAFFPVNEKTKCTTFTLQVRGYADSTAKWSAWVSASYKFLVPNDPVIKKSGNIFTSYADTSYTLGKGDPHVKDIEYETVISDVVKQSSVKWSEGGKGNVVGTYVHGTCANNSAVTCATQDKKTTWFRCRARGVAGASAWKYTNAMNVDPIAPTAVSGTMSGFNVTAKWTGHNTAENPTDTFKVYYAIDTPLSGLACPSGATWEVGASGILNNAKTTTFSIPQRPGVDKCLWVKVAAVYGSKEAISDPVWVIGGVMEPPTLSSCTIDPQTKSAALTWVNNSVVPDSKIGVVFGDGSVLASFNHGVTSGTVTYKSTQNVQFGVFVFQGTSPTKFNMKSATVYSGGGAVVPLQPTDLSITGTAKDGTVTLSWTNAWTDSNGTEISYADHDDAWDSTDEPTRYEVKERKTKWNVANLETGKTWFFKLRSIGQDEQGANAYGPYSDAVAVSLASAPEKPELFVSNMVIDIDESLSLTWAYTTTDNTDQAEAIIYDQPIGATDYFTGNGTTKKFTLERTPTSITSVTVDGETTSAYSRTGAVITFTNAPAASSSIIIQYAYTGAKVEIAHLNNNSLTWSGVPAWDYGSTHNLSVKCISQSGYTSLESDPVPVLVAARPVVNSIPACISAGISSGVLTAMPITLTITGAGTGGTTAILIKRKGTYKMARPDDSQLDGFDGETIYSLSYKGEQTISITPDDLVGSLDDGAKYRLIAMVTNETGRKAEGTLDFTVAWAHQASMPGASVAISNNTAIITPTAPASYVSGDAMDIYRLSADKPELIVEGGSFSRSYRDPYPAAGGGYRVVHRTKDGDYITGTNLAAWIDVYAASYDFDGTIIDFDGEQVVLPYNIALESQWEKEFTETKYLNGHIQGDWNTGTSRTGTITTNVSISDHDTITALRRLATFEGICQVRTSDGSSFAADIQVSEGRESRALAVEYSLTITRVDSESLDGEEVA